MLAPAREAATGILERGLHSQLPPAVQSAGLEAMHVALVKAVNTGALEGDGHGIATATLIAAGVPEKRASVVVERSRRRCARARPTRSDPAYEG